MAPTSYPYFPVAAEEVSSLPARERVGLNFQASTMSEGLSRVGVAEAYGVRQLWLTAGSVQGCDTLTFFASAASRTHSVRLGTAIVQVYTRHPLTVAQQAFTLDDLAPGRLRLGLGASHQHIVERMLGLSHSRPLTYLREYFEVVRSLLWEGSTSYAGKSLKVEAKLRRPAKIPLLLAALRSGAFRLAGEVADGAISWMCPVDYLLNKALPALKAGAEAKGRRRPPLVAHVLVSPTTSYEAAHRAAKKTVEYYGAAPFYQRMFEDAGYPITQKKGAVDELSDTLVIYGGEETIREKILETLSKGIDELLLAHLPTQDPEQEWVRLAKLVGSLQ